MNLNQLQQIVQKLRECDNAYGRMGGLGYSDPMVDALQGSVIERKNNLLNQLKAIGIEVDA